MYINDERFDQDSYGEESIIYDSKIITLQIDQNQPQWISYEL